MNRIFTLLISICFCVSLSVQTVNKPIILKKTATWCPNCGNWGWTFMEDLMDEFSDNRAVVVGLHYSGDLQNDVAKAIDDNFSSLGQPLFMYNGEDLFVNPSNSAQKLEDMKSMVADFNAATPEFEIEINASKGSDIVNMLYGELTLTPNITEANMDYYVALYLLEDNLERNQSGNVSDNIHPNVLQGNFLDGNFGELVYESGSMLDASDAMMLTSTFDMSTLNYTQGWAEAKLHAMAVVWSFDGTTYEVVQAEISPMLDFESSTEDIAWTSDISLFVDPSSVLNFNGSTPAALGEINISIYDISGSKLIAETMIMDSKEINYKTDLSEFRNGNYILNIQNKDFNWSKQFSKF